MEFQETNMTGKLKVLLTGPSGRVGPALVEAFAPVYELRTFDLQPIKGDDAAFAGDLTDLEVLRAAMKGVDVVVHLAATSDDAPFIEQLLRPNIEGAFNVHEAARLEGVRRIVFASSCQATSYNRDQIPVETDALPTPRNLYGVTKVFGEAMGRVFHQKHGLEWVGIRIGSWLPRDHAHLKRESGHRRLWLSPRDGASLFRRAIEHPDVGYAVVNGTSRIEGGIMSLQSARELLRWEPQDELPPIEE